MAASALGVGLRKLREIRGLSLRELAQLADVDHAYIYRLETGAKETPSDEVISKLVRALKTTRRDADILRSIARIPNVSVGLAEYAFADETVTLDELRAAAGVVHRGAARPDYKTLIERIRRILGDEL